MIHPYVIDSSLVYNLSHKRKARSSLKLLTKTFLGVDIQNHGPKGHDPTEDAAHSLKLIQLKLNHGMYILTLRVSLVANVYVIQ